MKESPEVDRIRFRMQRIRQHMDDDVDGLMANAQQLMDWKYHVRRHPMAAIAVAALAGYLLVPKPRAKVEKRVYLDRDGARELASHNDRIILEESEGASPSLFKSASIMAANALVRAGLAYMGQQIGKTSAEDPVQAHS